MARKPVRAVADDFAAALKPLLSRAKSKKLCAFARRALQNVQRGRYESVSDFKADGTQQLARAIDPDTLADLLALMVPLIQALLDSKDE